VTGPIIGQRGMLVKGTIDCAYLNGQYVGKEIVFLGKRGRGEFSVDEHGRASAKNEMCTIDRMSKKGVVWILREEMGKTGVSWVAMASERKEWALVSEGPEAPNEEPNGPNEGPNGPNEGPDGPNEGPNGPNEGPDGPNEGPNGPNEGPDGPNEGPNGPNEGPDAPNEGPNEPNFGPKGDHGGVPG
jgi:hypothetical protein